jgi:hypothetical protein
LENAIPTTTTTHPHPHNQGKEGKVFFRRNDRYRTHGPKEFTFDRVFSSKATQATVYREVATPLVDGLFEHINGCVVAYGQTGAGKTYTVVGPDNDVIKHTEEHAHRLGLVPRAIHDVFERIERKKQGERNPEGKGKGKTYTVRCSYVQVYLDECYDLLGHHANGDRSPWGARTRNVNRLHPEATPDAALSSVGGGGGGGGGGFIAASSSSQATPLAPSPHPFHDASLLSKHPIPKLDLRESQPDQPYLAGVQEVVCDTVYDMLSLLKMGATRKAVAATRMNLKSSRSHTLFTILLEEKTAAAAAVVSRLVCVDLAGSEREWWLGRG